MTLKTRDLSFSLIIKQHQQEQLMTSFHSSCILIAFGLFLTLSRLFLLLTQLLSFWQLFASGLCCENSPEFDDLFGFSVKDVLEEVKRGKRLVKTVDLKRHNLPVAC